MTEAEEYAYSVYPVKNKGFLYDLVRNNIIRGYEKAEKDIKERLLLMLNTSVNNKQFFEKLDGYFAE